MSVLIGAAGQNAQQAESIDSLAATATRTVIHRDRGLVHEDGHSLREFELSRIACRYPEGPLTSGRSPGIRGHHTQSPRGAALSAPRGPVWPVAVDARPRNPGLSLLLLRSGLVQAKSTEREITFPGPAFSWIAAP